MTPYYDEGGITIYHADCRDVLPIIDHIDLTFADPPYGVGMDYGEAYDDTLPDQLAYDQWLAPRRNLLLAASSLTLVTPGIRNLWLWPSASWVLAWNKPGSPRRADSGGFNIWEPVLVYGKRRVWSDAITLAAWNNTSGTAAEEHPCPKPLRLMHWLVTEFSDSGDIILDPFMGSGTTLRAAKDLNRNAIGIEVSERYCEIAARRLSQEVFDFAFSGVPVEPEDAPET